jgi:predicted DNA-binding protein
MEETMKNECHYTLPVRAPTFNLPPDTYNRLDALAEKHADGDVAKLIRALVIQGVEEMASVEEHGA